MIDILKLYRQEACQTPLLTQKEENDLFKLMQSTDKNIQEEAKEKLIKANLKLVIKIAYEFNRPSMLADMIAVGNAGLIYAVDHYIYRGGKLSYYAYPAIKHAIISFLDSENKNQNPLSLDYANEDGNDLYEFIADTNKTITDKIDVIEDTERALELLKHLTEREQTLIEMRYGLDGKKPMTLDAIGKVIGYTNEGVRQLILIALKKLRKMMDDECLEVA
jgi:RNA polymerase sigma factor (sigma-70 family)